ncbi:MAG: sulfotransferase [Sandaracinaceae bacterium]
MAYTFDAARIPLTVRLARALRRPAGPLDPASVIEDAESAARLDDLGDDDYAEPLRRLLDSARSDPSLSDAGRATLRRHAVASLTTRLRVQRWFTRRPAIAATEVRAPLVIVGFPRSGTTFLHGLLHQHPRLRAPELWQLRRPTPPPDARLRRVDPRIALARADLAIGRSLLPELGALHPTGAHHPEECGYLLDPALLNPLIPSGEAYQRWWQETDLRPGYRMHRRMLQLLSWRWPTPRWVVKAPFHLYHLEALLEVYPDARFVHLHRDPREAIPSAASWAALRARAFSSSIALDVLGREVLETTAALAERILEQRDRIGDERFLDVTYEELTGATLEVCRRILAHAGDAWRAPDATPLEAWLERSRARHRARPHRYAPAQFGLQDEEIDERMGAYLRRFRPRRGR